jgi:hypothetical protein
MRYYLNGLQYFFARLLPLALLPLDADRMPVGQDPITPQGLHSGENPLWPHPPSLAAPKTGQQEMDPGTVLTAAGSPGWLKMGALQGWCPARVGCQYRSQAAMASRRRPCLASTLPGRRELSTILSFKVKYL